MPEDQLRHPKRIEGEVISVYTVKSIFDGMKKTYLEYDPNRNALHCLIHYGDGEKRYMLHTRGAIMGRYMFLVQKSPLSREMPYL
ncbi:hypothetical protein C4D60_Mb00t17290 [Musa balbisiana]|uniref:Large ribosomal subunit protein uL2 RNA-binding domain-containing protein n=1 Tax=Musa balbisiana TaxID=52838 RepID=A0A4V4H211_MUSBA|nr:hypothetical protein C4D60_Mb00t17290 [Musa balbisiana]